MYAKRYNVDMEWLDSMGTYPIRFPIRRYFLVAPHKLEPWSRAGGGTTAADFGGVQEDLAHHQKPRNRRAKRCERHVGWYRAGISDPVGSISTA
jgi:hypothetical protein